MIMDMFPDSTIYLTTILEENLQAIRFLEKKRKSMPAYHLITPLVTFCILCGTATKPTVNWHRAVAGDISALTFFLREEGSQIPNFPVFTEGSFEKDNFPGIEDFILIKSIFFLFIIIFNLGI